MTERPLDKIMLVEDDPDIQEVAVMALADFGGFTVEVCSSGLEALERVGDIAPDLVLLDVMMPGMDGPTALKELKADAATSAIPVVFMTARSQPHEVEEYKALGAVDVITKPFDPIQLGDVVRGIWAGIDD
jgi:CheY-like chemotaxis protein